MRPSTIWRLQHEGGMSGNNWPNRVRCDADHGYLTMNGAASHMARQRGSFSGFYDPDERLALDGSVESAYQGEQRQARQALRTKWAETDRTRKAEGTA